VISYENYDLVVGNEGTGGYRYRNFEILGYLDFGVLRFWGMREGVLGGGKSVSGLRYGVNRE